MHASTARGGAKNQSLAPDGESLGRFAETLRLRSLADTTQAEYLRFVRKLAARHRGDPVGLDEAQVRASASPRGKRKAHKRPRRGDLHSTPGLFNRRPDSRSGESERSELAPTKSARQGAFITPLCVMNAG